MGGDEKQLNDFLITFRDEFNKLPPEEIAYPRSCNGIRKFRSESSIFQRVHPCILKVV